METVSAGHNLARNHTGFTPSPPCTKANAVRRKELDPGTWEGLRMDTGGHISPMMCPHLPAPPPTHTQESSASLGSCRQHRAAPPGLPPPALLASEQYRSPAARLVQDLLRSERHSLLQEDRMGECLEGCGRAGCGLCGSMRHPPMTRSSFPGETPGVGSNTRQGGSWKLGRHDGL